MTWMWLALLGCDGGESVDTDDGPLECGDATPFEVQILGRVEDESGSGVAGAEVLLEDRAWNLGDLLGSATSGGDGSFTLDASNVIGRENCWGQLNYTLMATEGDRSGEKTITTYLFNAIDSGTNQTNVTDFPVVVD